MFDTCKGRLRPPVFILAALLWAATGSPAAASTKHLEKAYVRLDSFTYSEPVSIATAFDDWRGDYVSGKQQFTWNWLEIGMRFERWRIAALYRFDMALDFSTDTADLYHAVQNNTDLNAERRYALDLRARRYSATGLRIGLPVQLSDGFDIEWGLALFHASQLIDGRLSGSDVSASVDYFYSKDELFGRDTSPPRGLGASLDLKFNWAIDSRHHLSGEITDLLGYIQWKNAPFTQADASSERHSLGTDGYLTIDPVVTGSVGTQPRLTQRLTPRLQLGFSRRLSGHISALLDYRYQYHNHFTGIGAMGQVGDQSIGLRYWPQTESLEVLYRHRHWRFSLGMDTAHWRQAHGLWLHFSYGG